MTALPDLSPEELAAYPRWQRNTGIFLAGQTVSLFGSMLVQYAVLWYLTLTTKDGAVLGIALVIGFAPQAVVSIFGGVWADRLNRKALIIGADLAIAAATLVLAIVMLSGQESLLWIYGALAVRSIGAGIQTPAVGALLPQLVPTSRLLRVNGMFASIQSVLMLVAPAVAALLYATMEMGAILLVDVVTAVIGVGLLILIPVATIRNPADEKRGYFDDLKEGLRYVVRHPFVRWLLVMFAVMATLVGAPSFLTPLLVAREFGEEVWKLTVLEICFAIGMMIGGAALAAWGHRAPRMRLIAGSVVLMAVFSAGLGLAPNLIVFFVFMFLMGLAVPGMSTVSMTLLQEVVEPERHGRVFSFVGIVGAVAMPIGMALFGPLSNVWSVGTVLVVSAAAMLLVLVVAFLVPAGRRAWQHANTTAAGPAQIGPPL